MTKPIVPWMGGKGRLAKHILPLFPPHTCYVEVFAGGAALFFKKDVVKSEVLNDINGELVNLYRVAKHHLEELVHQFNYALVSRQIFEWLKTTPPETLTDVQRAARLYYLQRACFGAKVDCHTFGTSTTCPPKLRLTDIKETLGRSWPRLSQALIEQLDWKACIQKYDRSHTLFYLDPPYWQTAGYGASFPFSEYERMAEVARSVQGMMVISLNDHPDIRQVFGDLDVRQVDIKYTVGGGGGKKASEVLILNQQCQDRLK